VVVIGLPFHKRLCSANSRMTSTAMIPSLVSALSQATVLGQLSYMTGAGLCVFGPVSPLEHGQRTGGSLQGALGHQAHGTREKDLFFSGTTLLLESRDGSEK